MRHVITRQLLILAATFLASASIPQSKWVAAQTASWTRYTIDDSLSGADGVKLADANGDGLLDIVTGFEESGQTRAYFHPGYARAQQAWPSVTVGPAPAVEDAVWVDLNGDGRLDVLSSCEGQEMSLRAHLAPPVDQLLDARAWSTQIVPQSQNATRWMFAVPFALGQQTDLQLATSIPDIVVGSKSPRGLVGILRTGSSSIADWRIEKLANASWIMSLTVLDIDHDGDEDILYSDRKPDDAGVFWLENPADAQHAGTTLPNWNRHLVGAPGTEVMFIASAARRRNQAEQPHRLFAAVKPNLIYQLTANVDARTPWQTEIIPVSPAVQIGFAKGIAVGDLDEDGQDELVFSCESANAPKSGVVYLQLDHSKTKWQMHDVSGPEGIKFDLVELVDLDGDGDLDVLTCEERASGRGLGVIWYANPLRE